MYQDYTKSYAEIWESCSIHFPLFPKTYSPSEKLQKEQILDQYLQSIKAFRKEKISLKTLTEADQYKYIRNTRAFLHDGLDFTSGQLELMFSDQLIEQTRAFVRQARAFDAGLSFNDIFQACRNAWIMNGLQLIMGIPVQLTPSIFAYSMLYPYTDNLIDDPNIAAYEKMNFSVRFRNRLSGQQPEPVNATEHAVFRLVGMIEAQYSRTEFPELFESLLGIHDAQTQSLKLIQDADQLSEQDTLNICMGKGGASVLADGYLVAGNLSADQKYFLYGYGAYLQLLDDIQDVEEDRQAGLMTVFSKPASRPVLEERLNKTYWFGEEVMKSLDRFKGQHLDLFKSLMRRSMDLFVSEAIAQNPDVYSIGYIAAFENYSPYHFSYIRRQKEQFATYNGFLLTAIEEIAFTENRILTV